jgi:hypothetical protein
MIPAYMFGKAFSEQMQLTCTSTFILCPAGEVIIQCSLYYLRDLSYTTILYHAYPKQIAKHAHSHLSTSWSNNIEFILQTFQHVVYGLES